MFSKSDKDQPQSFLGDTDSATKPARNFAAESKGLRAVLGASLQFKGDLKGDEDLEIQGSFEGAIELKNHNLTIGRQGSVKANIQAKFITIEGALDGDLVGEEQIVIRASGNVKGNLVAPRVSLDDGAKFKGSIDMEPKVERPSSMSSLKSVDKDKSSSMSQAKTA